MGAPIEDQSVKEWLEDVLKRELKRSNEDIAWLASDLSRLGEFALLQGDHGRATALHVESLALSQELGNKIVAVESLDGLACAAGASEETGRAARLFGAAQALREALREALGFYQPPAVRTLREPYLMAARSRLDEAAWAEAFEKAGS